MPREYELHFELYERNQLPEVAGIYCLYRGSFRLGKIYELLYIGEETDMWDRVDPNKHDAWKRWKAECLQGQKLFITAAAFDGTDENRVRAECALIHEHQPPYNKRRCKQSFPYDGTTVVTIGHNYKLKNHFRLAGEDAKPEHSREATLPTLWRWFRSK